MKRISMKIKLSIIFFSAMLLVSLNCGDQALFDELATNRIKVVIKGTYESNSPQGWHNPVYTEDDVEATDSIYVWPFYTDDIPPATFMLDIAGMKLDSEYFANFRKTYTASLNDSDSFFNDGVVFRNNDVKPNHTFSTLKVYIRKMLFDGARQYVPTAVDTWASDTTDVEGTVENGNVQDMFEEKNVNGFNFNLAQVLSYYDSLKNNYDEINRIFPLAIPIEDGFVFNNEDPETVLEVRLVIKNFVKKYEYEYEDDDDNRKLRHFYALSDWLRDVKRDEAAPTTDTMGKMGGNLLAVARSYVPGKTANISSLSDISYRASANRYVIAVDISRGHSVSDYNFTLPDRPKNFRDTLDADVCDQPKTPRLPLNPSGTFSDAYMQALLDYYLQYEVYKQYYDYFVDNVDSGLRDTAWDDNYEDILSTFKIPSLVTYSDGSGDYTFENVPAGTYNVYQADSATNIGDLPELFNSTALITNVTISESNYGTTVP